MGSSILIALHVITAIVFLGPVTYAVSAFPTRAFEAHEGNKSALGAAQNLFKVTQGYGNLSIIVPLLGFAIMFTGDYWSNGKFHASIALSIIAWGILYFLIVPRQKNMLGALGGLDADEQAEFKGEVTDWKKAKGQLAMFGGIFSLLWVIIAFLMIL